MSARRAAAVLALLAVALGAWFACSSRQAVDDKAPAESQAIAPPRRDEAPSAARAIPRQRAQETPPAAPAEPTGNVIRGHVLLRNGSPAAGARVRAWSVARMREGEPAEVGSEAHARDDGSFVIGGAEEGDHVVVYAVLPGHHTTHPPSSVKIDGPVTEVTIRFGEGGVLTGRVAGPMGKPAGGVEVRLRPAKRDAHTRHSGDFRAWTVPGVWEFYAATTRTDPDGAYRFDGVPLPRNGALQMRVPVASVDGKDWAGEEVGFETDGQELERDIVIGETPWIDVPLPEAPPERQPRKVRVTGTVASPEGSALAGATVTYLELEGPGSTSWIGTTTQADGTFEIEERLVKPSVRLEVRAAARGFRTFRGPPPDEGAMTIRLEPADRAPLPGRIAGKMTAADKPLTGPVRVTAVDEMYRVHHFWTWADAHGAYVLEGLAPGEWQVFLLWSEPWLKATVPEGGEARVNLSVHLTASELAPEPWTEEKAAQFEKLANDLDKLRAARGIAAAKGQSTQVIEEKFAHFEAAIAPLDEVRVASLPVREILVTGLPKDAGCVLVAKDGLREWRGDARDGAARFAGLSVRKWTFTLVRPGASDVVQEAEVVKGDGAQTIAFAPH